MRHHQGTQTLSVVLDWAHTRRHGHTRRHRHKHRHTCSGSGNVSKCAKPKHLATPAASQSLPPSTQARTPVSTPSRSSACTRMSQPLRGLPAKRSTQPAGPVAAQRDTNTTPHTTQHRVVLIRTCMTHKQVMRALHGVCFPTDSCAVVVAPSLGAAAMTELA